jgi:large conductance mechanosensitive channel
MKMLDEFKAFAVKGNVMDMAVGIIIGGAFGKIVSSFVNDVIMPPIGVLVGGVNFSDLSLILVEATEQKPAVMLNYGNFMQVTFDFLIIAFSVFMMVKALNAAKKKEEAKPEPATAAPAPTKEELLLSEIRDILKNK